jgi:hypothetical protein
MKNEFSEFYSPKKDEFKKLWKEAIFVLDTNVLLSLYRYPPKTQAKLFASLRKLKKQLWIPHQVAIEFYRRRLSVICAQEKTYTDILPTLARFEGQYLEHPFLYDKKITKAVKNACNNIRAELKKLDTTRPKWLHDDKVLENIEKIIGNKIGKPYDAAKLKEIYAEGGERYEKEVPPGYKDAEKDKSDKSKTRKFGDLLIWYQIIDKAKVEKKPIIFVTDEQKEDWWWKEEGGRNIGARFELKKEMLDKAGMLLHMYQSDQFIEHSREHLNTKFNDKFITEIKKVRQTIVNDSAQTVGLSASSADTDSEATSVSNSLSAPLLGAEGISIENATNELAQSAEPKSSEEKKDQSTI